MSHPDSHGAAINPTTPSSIPAPQLPRTPPVHTPTHQRSFTPVQNQNPFFDPPHPSGNGSGGGESISGISWSDPHVRLGTSLSSGPRTWRTRTTARSSEHLDNWDVLHELVGDEDQEDSEAQRAEVSSQEIRRAAGQPHSQIPRATTSSRTLRGLFRAGETPALNIPRGREDAGPGPSISAVLSTSPPQMEGNGNGFCNLDSVLLDNGKSHAPGEAIPVVETPLEETVPGQGDVRTPLLSVGAITPSSTSPGRRSTGEWIVNVETVLAN